MAPYLMGTDHRETDCYVCLPASKRHLHCSTQFYYKRCYRLGRRADCFTCLDPDHPPQSDGRIKLVSTSSFLHNVQKCPTFEAELMKTIEASAASFHIDVDQITGGTLEDLRQSWRRLYWNQPLPVDTAVAAGLNDVARFSVNEILETMRRWRQMVAEHSARNGHRIPNTIGFSTPLRAPAFYWHTGNPFPPPLGYVNLKEKVDILIDRIKKFNVESGTGGMVLFHTEGDRKTWGMGVHHCWTLWREFYTKPGQPDQFLHLIDEKRVGCFMKIFKYFLYQTTFISENPPPCTIHQLPSPISQPVPSSRADTAPEVENSPPYPTPTQPVPSSLADTALEGRKPVETPEKSQETRSQCVTAEMSKAKSKLSKRRRRKEKVKAKQAKAVQGNSVKLKEHQDTVRAVGETVANIPLEEGEESEGGEICEERVNQILDEPDSD